MPMINQGEKDDKIIVVCADDPEYRHCLAPSVVSAASRRAVHCLHLIAPSDSSRRYRCPQRKLNIRQLQEPRDHTLHHSPEQLIWFTMILHVCPLALLHS